LPFSLQMKPRSAWQSRTADSTSVSRTGRSSNFERLITLRTSLVAVWYSSDSCSSRLLACQQHWNYGKEWLERIAPRRESQASSLAYGWRKFPPFDLAFGERAHFGAPDEDHANWLACVDQRDAERGAITGLERSRPALGVFIRFGQDVCDLNCSTFEDGTPWNEPTHKG
jgi:hypothetical protein